MAEKKMAFGLAIGDRVRVCEDEDGYIDTGDDADFNNSANFHEGIVVGHDASDGQPVVLLDEEHERSGNTPNNMRQHIAPDAWTRFAFEGQRHAQRLIYIGSEEGFKIVRRSNENNLRPEMKYGLCTGDVIELSLNERGNLSDCAYYEGGRKVKATVVGKSADTLLVIVNEDVSGAWQLSDVFSVNGKYDDPKQSYFLDRNVLNKLNVSFDDCRAFKVFSPRAFKKLEGVKMATNVALNRVEKAKAEAKEGLIRAGADKAARGMHTALLSFAKSHGADDVLISVLQQEAVVGLLQLLIGHGVDFTPLAHDSRVNLLAKEMRTQGYQKGIGQGLDLALQFVTPFVQQAVAMLPPEEKVRIEEPAATTTNAAEAEEGEEVVESKPARARRAA